MGKRVVRKWEEVVQGLVLDTEEGFAGSAGCGADGLASWAEF